MEETIYLLRQVNDFTLACYNESATNDIYDKIGDALQLPSESDKSFYHLGLIMDVNVIDIDQSCDYIQIYCTNYIEIVMISHYLNEEKSNIPDKIDSPLPIE